MTIFIPQNPSNPCIDCGVPIFPPYKKGDRCGICEGKYIKKRFHTINRIDKMRKVQ